jgi:hypothetical protein
MVNKTVSFKVNMPLWPWALLGVLMAILKHYGVAWFSGVDTSTILTVMFFPIVVILTIFVVVYLLSCLRGIIKFFLEFK